jgi:hypothetical protein
MEFWRLKLGYRLQDLMECFWKQVLECEVAWVEWLAYCEFVDNQLHSCGPAAIEQLRIIHSVFSDCGDTMLFGRIFQPPACVLQLRGAKFGANSPYLGLFYVRQTDISTNRN